MRQVVLDTETTGLKIEDGHRIIEIGCIELVNRKITGRHYHQYINPQRAIDEGALAVHGITNAFLMDKPIFSEMVEEFIQFIYGAELIIHNASFDIGFINYELSLIKNKWQPLNEENTRITDTLHLARQLHAGQRNTLDALCKRYTIDNSQRELHGALLDANLLAKVYLAMTGGQGSLFEELQRVDQLIQNAEERSVVKLQTRQLHILKANSEELLQHSEQLQKMREKGKCIWDQVITE
ncbi:MAG: DNA polymerase III subunit epsilon [Gammaproteobacteria bacterium]|nr:DNA polymerase III subunit epsilon [Gammaproteobacteria bacterium]